MVLEDSGERWSGLGAGGTEVLRSRHFVDVLVVVLYGGRVCARELKRAQEMGSDEWRRLTTAVSVAPLL